MIDFRERRLIPDPGGPRGSDRVDRAGPADARPRGGAAGAERRPAGLCPLRRGRADRGDLPARRRGDPENLRTGGSRQWPMRSSRASEQPRGGGSRPRRRCALSSRRRSARSGSRTSCCRAWSASSTCAARRIAKDDERDLDQAKVGIDAGRALVDLVSPEAQPQLRQAISELQVLYAKHAGEGPADEETGDESSVGPEQPKGDSGLWTPSEASRAAVPSALDASRRSDGAC